MSTRITLASLVQLLLLLLLIVSSPLTLAETEQPENTKTWQDFSQQLDQAEKILRSKPPVLDELEKATVHALAAGQFALGCLSENEAEQARLQTALESLGEQSPHEDNDLQKTRSELDTQKNAIEKNLSQCRLLSVRAKDIQDQVGLKKQEMLKNLLLAPEKSFLDYLLHTLQQPGLWVSESKQVLLTFGSLLINTGNVWRAFLYGITGMLTAFFWNIYRRQKHLQAASWLEPTSPTLASIWDSTQRMLPWLLLFGLFSLSLYFDTLENKKSIEEETISVLVFSLLIFTVSYTLLRSVLRSAVKLQGINPLSPRASRKLFFWARLCVLTTLLANLFLSTPFQTETSGGLIGLVGIGFGTLSSLSLIRLIWVLHKHLDWLKQFRLYLIASLALLAGIAALWLGYRNFAFFLFSSTFGSLFALLLSWFLYRIPTEIFDGLDEGRAPWQKRLRTRLGLADKTIMPGMIWLRLTHTALILGGTGLTLLRLWGMSEQSLQVMLTRLMNGFQIGDFTLEPLRIIGGLLILALLISFSHLLKNSLANNWLDRTNLSRGAKEATVTIAGYIGILLAILIGLSVAGIQFTNLAIIAGALSVGIGFGLQNIVNNFVSGLILLFERPIRRGDWIRVGTSEGYVREISIRSTVIQTFDRSDIIVPNSELISNQVTNMMLSNQYGRVIIPVGVAYGTDSDLVMKTLYKVAEKHPAVLREQGELKIQIYFRSFGESALNFELRCHIRDVESQMPVTSELNQAIYKAFHEQGIEMPFPQRTLHYANFPESLLQKTAKSTDFG
ncbi:MAG: mechanosensitive ion channel [Thiolinea sp.]